MAKVNAKKVIKRRKERKNVEKGAAHQLLPMEGKPGETGQPVAVIGYGQAVQQPGGGAVLNVLIDSL